MHKWSQRMDEWVEGRGAVGLIALSKASPTWPRKQQATEGSPTQVNRSMVEWMMLVEMVVVLSYTVVSLPVGVVGVGGSGGNAPPGPPINCGCEWERNLKLARPRRPCGFWATGGNGAARNLLGFKGRFGGNGGGVGDLEVRQLSEVSLLRRESKNAVLL